jgi:hypothetical protein
MAILFDRDFGRVWWDGTTPFVFASVVRVPVKKEMDALAEKQIELIREVKSKFGDVYSILDLSLCPVLPNPIILHYVTTIAPRQFRAGVMHKAFVMPGEKEPFQLLVKSFTLISHFPVSLHTSFENALDEINRRRRQAEPKRERSFFGALLAWV